MPIVHQNAQNTGKGLGGRSLDLINGHLTDSSYIPVVRGLPKEPKGWYKPVSWVPSKELNFVAKVQPFCSGGYEVTVSMVSLKSIAAVSDAPRLSGKREKGEQSESDVISSVQRSKRRIRHLIKSQGCDRLLTLTKRESELGGYWGVEQWAAAWDRFNRSCKKMGVVIQYVAVLERHKKGNYHLHAAIVGRINVNHIRRIWWSICGGRGCGNVDVKMRRNCTDHKRRAGLAKYVSKYVSKQVGQTEFNKKRYWSSRHKLPDVRRYILNADDLMASLVEVAGLLSLDAGVLVADAFRFGGGVGAWFSYDEYMAGDVPF